ncbi:FCD domain-containing protein (plasmid) [Tistrella mobilis]|uniref:FadR/GntR family transcriptional regulator n=1 Tax=Tistrella mobilis TaxID=171437 RepID=UPI003559272E
MAEGRSAGGRRGAPTRRRPKLSELIVEDVKRRIVTEQLKPGDRLPGEAELIRLHGCSKGTVREALKGLEVEGLVVSRTGPGGGAWLARPTHDHASRALRNFLQFRHPDGHQIYALRKLIEPEVAVLAVGRLGPADFEVLEANIALCAHEPVTEEEQRIQRIAEIDFHNVLADVCPNPIFGFLGRFLNELLRDVVVLKKVYLPERRQFGLNNVDYHRRLIEAFRREDAAEVRRLMLDHMCDAEDHLDALEAEVARRFLLEPGSG